MKEKYITPEVRVEVFETADVITSSTGYTGYTELPWDEEDGWD